MNDLISREAAINAIINTPSMVHYDMTLQSKYDGSAFRQNEIIDILSKLPPAQQWTPVAEGLPKVGVRYQVTFESGEVGYADFRNKIFLCDGSVIEDFWEIDEYYEDDGKVIAWMPLPEPYEPTQSNDSKALDQKREIS